jgi:hypothetical protein
VAQDVTIIMAMIVLGSSPLLRRSATAVGKRGNRGLLKQAAPTGRSVTPVDIVRALDLRAREALRSAMATEVAKGARPMVTPSGAGGACRCVGVAA